MSQLSSLRIVPKFYLKNVYYALFNSLISYYSHILGNCSGIPKALIPQNKT